MNRMEQENKQVSGDEPESDLEEHDIDVGAAEAEGDPNGVE